MLSAMLAMATHSFFAGSYCSTELSQFWPSKPPITYSLPSTTAAAGQLLPDRIVPWTGAPSYGPRLIFGSVPHKFQN